MYRFIYRNKQNKKRLSLAVCFSGRFDQRMNTLALAINDWAKARNCCLPHNR
jgi:hypothetical protein